MKTFTNSRENAYWSLGKQLRHLIHVLNMCPYYSEK